MFCLARFRERGIVGWWVHLGSTRQDPYIPDLPIWNYGIGLSTVAFKALWQKKKSLEFWRRRSWTEKCMSYIHFEVVFALWWPYLLMLLIKFGRTLKAVAPPSAFKSTRLPTPFVHAVECSRNESVLRQLIMTRYTTATTATWHSPRPLLLSRDVCIRISASMPFMRTSFRTFLLGCYTCTLKQAMAASTFIKIIWRFCTVSTLERVWTFRNTQCAQICSSIIQSFKADIRGLLNIHQQVEPVWIFLQPL
jgi:hypothetical protein